MANYVGPQSAADGLSPFDAERVDRSGAKIITPLHGSYYEQNERSRVYVGNSVAGGIALIAPTAGGGHPTLWNPSNSRRNISVVSLLLGYVSGANAPGTLQWAGTRNTGDNAATGSPIQTATLVDPQAGMLGGPLDFKAYWSPTVQTFLVAPVFYRSTGLSLFTGVAATAVAPFSMEASYEGSLVLAPGSAISLTYQGATTTALFQVTVVWEEIPLP